MEEENVAEQEDRKREYWSHSTGYNQMCFKCPALHSGCIGSKNTRWTNCTRRVQIERREFCESFQKSV